MPRLATTALLLLLSITGCTPPLKQSGFISDYSRLVQVNDRTARYISPRARDYSMVTIDPVESRLPPRGALSDQDRAEALRYLQAACERAFTAAGFTVVNEPGTGVARVKIALTDITASTGWMKIHPGMRFVGAGTGGATMEAEVIDSVTGEQLAAVVEFASGNQFNLTAFSTLDDVKSAMDQWARITAHHLREFRSGDTVP